MTYFIDENALLHNRQRIEAIKRLNKLTEMGLHPDVMKSFIDNGSVDYSERTPFCGALYTINDNDILYSKMFEFEEEHNATVYHATLTYTDFGTILDFFYVSQYEEEWEDDFERLCEGYSCNYALNLSDPDLSEFGWEMFEVKGGGLIRTA